MEVIQKTQQNGQEVMFSNQRPMTYKEETPIELLTPADEAK